MKVATRTERLGIFGLGSGLFLVFHRSIDIAEREPKAVEYSIIRYQERDEFPFSSMSFIQFGLSTHRMSTDNAVTMVRVHRDEPSGEL